jgi:hypothetical protein
MVWISKPPDHQYMVWKSRHSRAPGNKLDIQTTKPSVHGRGFHTPAWTSTAPRKGLEIQTGISISRPPLHQYIVRKSRHLRPRGKGLDIQTTTPPVYGLEIQTPQTTRKRSGYPDHQPTSAWSANSYTPEHQGKVWMSLDSLDSPS